MTTEIVRIPTTPDRCDELVRAIDSARAGYLAPPRCAGVRTLRAENGAAVVAILDWSSRAAHDEATRSPAGAAFLAAVQPLAAGPPEIAWYRGV